MPNKFHIATQRYQVMGPGVEIHLFCGKISIWDQPEFEFTLVSCPLTTCEECRVAERAHIKDIEYVQKKIFDALKVPRKYLTKNPLKDEDYVIETKEKE